MIFFIIVPHNNLSQYCKSLQKAGLTVSMAPDDDFEGGDSEE
jgi:hypothetical protein